MIRVICTDISGSGPSDYQALYDRASEERKSRADRYRRQEDSLRCVTADGLLRYALGTSAYTVGKGPSGKPFIREREDFHYNLSHAGNWVAIAFGGSEVGVDVEKLRPDTDIDAISRCIFAPEERRCLLEEEKDRLQRFFEIWTGKESYLKYLGTGLQKDPTSFSVLSLGPEVRLHHRKLDDDHCLSLCTTCDDFLFELLDLQRLL